MLKNKKGLITGQALWFLFDLIFTIVIFFLLFSFVDSAAESTIFEKNFLAKDTALLLETLYAAPGTVNLNYEQETLWFTFNFEDNQVQIYDVTENPDPPQSARSTFPFIQDKKVSFESKIVTPDVVAKRSESFLKKLAPFSWITTDKPIEEEKSSVILKFFKDRNQLRINPSNASEKIECPIIDTSKPSKITLTPKTEEGEISTFTDSLRLQLNNQVLTLTKDTFELKDEVMLIKIEFTEENVIRAKIRVEAQRSGKLACLIVNNLLEQYPELKGEIILSQDAILGQAPVSIILEIGKEQQNQGSITRIINALGAYFENE